MEYKGKLYGKAGEVVFPLLHSTDDWEAMEKKIAELEAQIKSQKSAIPIVSGSLPTDTEIQEWAKKEAAKWEKDKAKAVAYASNLIDGALWMRSRLLSNDR